MPGGSHPVVVGDRSLVYTIGMPLRTLLVVLMLAAGVPAQEAAPPVELPDDAMEALEETWKGWTPAAIDAEAAACAKNGASAAPPLLTDLDSDGHGDYVLAVQTSSGPRLVAVLYRVSRYVVHDLDELASGVPLMAPRAAKFTPAGGGVDDYFPADTRLVRRCGQPDVAYLWNGFGFRKTPLAGGTAPAPATR